MKTLQALINRNRKLFFRDRGMLFSSLITPVILIVLYATFLAKVYKDSFTSYLPKILHVSEKLIDGAVASQLGAALLAVSCVTVTFCVNLTMVQDKASGARKDFDVSPVKRPVLYLGYFCATVFNSLMVNVLALVLCLFYIRKMGWYLSATDLAWMVLDVLLLVLFGAVLSSIICYPLKTQGQMSAVGTIVSAGYADVQFRRRITEIFILPSGYVWNISAEKSYVKRRVCTDERGWISKTECHRDCKKSRLPSDVRRRSCFYAGDDCCYGSEHSDIGSGLFGGDSYFYKKEYRQILGIDKRADDSVNIDKKWNNLTKIKI